MYFKDLTPTGRGTIAIGWLDNGQEYAKGNVDKDIVAYLKQHPTSYQTRGIHRCPFCNGSTSSNEIVVESDGKRYNSPRMIVHYIEEHGYSPPDEYISAVKKAMSSKDGLNVTYETVVHRIGLGTVTEDDFNRLIEATDKSAKERIFRRTRDDNGAGRGKSMIGRVVPKKTGRNDPPEQGRGRRYASGTPAKKRQNEKQARKASSVHGALVREGHEANEALESLKKLCADKKADGIVVYYNDGPPKLIIVDVLDWGDEEHAKEIGKAASKLVGDEARVIWQNEGTKPSSTAGWKKITVKHGKEKKETRDA